MFVLSLRYHYRCCLFHSWRSLWHYSLFHYERHFVAAPFAAVEEGVCCCWRRRLHHRPPTSPEPGTKLLKLRRLKSTRWDWDEVATAAEMTGFLLRSCYRSEGASLAPTRSKPVTDRNPHRLFPLATNTALRGEKKSTMRIDNSDASSRTST